MEYKKPSTLKFKEKLNKRNDDENINSKLNKKTHNGLSSNESENYGSSPTDPKINIQG